MDADKNKRKLLVTCGLTATGKTSLAIRLAEKFNGEIVSADSRQVYRGLDIGTGKDLPKDAVWLLSKIPNPNGGLMLGYWRLDNGIKIWGYDLVEPDREFSISHYLNIAKKIIEDIWDRGKLPIVIGGTGFYITGLLYGIDTADVPKNNELRVFLEEKKIEELFEMLAEMDSIKAASMNSSDRKNRRRLTRALEVAEWRLQNEGGKKGGIERLNAYTLVIGLMTGKEKLKSILEQRVDKRIKEGFQEEIERLIVSGINWDSQSMNTLGYRQYKDYFFGRKTKEEVINDWISAEFKYSKRQMTWFKKKNDIFWFDVTGGNFPKDVEILVDKWNNSKD